MHTHVMTVIFIYSTNFCLHCAQYSKHHSVSAPKEPTVPSLFLFSFITKSKLLNSPPILMQSFQSLCFY